MHKGTQAVLVLVIWTCFTGISGYLLHNNPGEYITHPLAWHFFRARLHEERMNLLATRMQNEALENWRRPVSITVEHPVQFPKVLY